MDSPTNYFGIFPIKLYDETNGDAGLCVTFSFLVSLSSEAGYCDVTDRYLSELLGKSERTITRRLQKLEELGYIRCEFIDTDDGTKRRVYICVDGGYNL